MREIRMTVVLIAISLVIIFTLLYMAVSLKNPQNAVKSEAKKGKISGMVLRKIDGSGVEGVEVLLGNLDSVEGKHVFKSEKGKKTVTDNMGRYGFENIEVGSYWVYIYVNGRKTVRMVKISDKNPVNEEVLLTV